MLISDPDYLIHTLRLNYLRHLDDPYGPRIISLNPRHSSNPYIRAAGLADQERWPELNMPSSPQPVLPELPSMSAHGYSDPGPSNPNAQRAARDPAEPAGMWPGATGLKHTQTIYGQRKGGAGMRVSGVAARRSSGVRQSGVSSLTTLDSRLHRIRSDSAPTPVSAGSSPVVSVKITSDSPDGTLEVSHIDRKRRSSGGSTIMGGSSNPDTPAETPLADSRYNTLPATGAAAPSANTFPAQGTPDGQDPARPPLPSFALRFARGAEMEARRRLRMRARFDGAAARAAQSDDRPTVTPQTVQGDENTPVPHQNWQNANESAVMLSSDEDEEPPGQVDLDDRRIIESDESDETTTSDEDGLMVDDLDEAEGEEAQEEDEFDGDEYLAERFGPRPIITSATISDDNSLMSSSALSVSHPSAFASSLQVAANARNRSRLSPVSEAHGERRDSAEPSTDDKEAAVDQAVTRPSIQPLAPVPRRPNRSFFSVSPPQKPINGDEHSRSAMTTASDVTKVGIPVVKETTSGGGQAIEAPPGVTLTSDRRARPSFSNRPSEPSFTRQKVVPLSARPPMKSSLTSILANQTAVPDNPFTELYAAIAARAGNPVVTLRVWFPHSKRASEEPIELHVRKDATVEEVIGFGLWSYWDKEIEPRLDEGLKGDDDPKREIRLNAMGWNLRIAEDDGEIDEDFPALDRTRPISKFSFDDFGICEATHTQVEQNRSVETKIVRRPSRLTIAKKGRSEGTTGGGGGAGANLLPPSAAPGASTSLTNSDALTSSALTGVSAPMGTVHPQGPPIFLRVRVATTADMHYSTTINSTADTYMADVLDRVCRRRRLDTPKEWALVTGDMRIVIPLDRTVASLAGKAELVLVKRSLLDQLGLGKDNRLGRTSDPNASIFKRFSEVPTQTGIDFTAAYKKFAVLRKMPMLVGRHERTLAIDGDYIHIMPAGTRGLLDSTKTSSYHIKSVVYCKQSKKAPTTLVKLIVWRDGGNKRYDFEAEDGKKAAEIVSTIKNLQKTYSLERTGTIKQSTKSRRPRPLR